MLIIALLVFFVLGVGGKECCKVGVLCFRGRGRVGVCWALVDECLIGFWSRKVSNLAQGRINNFELCNNEQDLSSG